MAKKPHIDDVQPATIDEHERLLIEDKNIIDLEFSEVTPADLPEWFDEELFKAGQAYIMRNLFSIAISHMIGLVAILSVPDILKILIFTNQSSSVCSAFKRYSETLLYTTEMFWEDVKDPNSKWYKSINIIRRKHATSNRRAKKTGFNGIYQKDMGITQFAFVGYTLLHPSFLGVTNRPDEVAGYNHFFRIFGHMLGISDRINICRKAPEETTELCNRIANNIIAKHMTDAPPSFLTMASHAIGGMSYIDAAIHADTVIFLTHEFSGLKYKKPLGLYTRLNMAYIRTMLYACSIPYVGTVVRVLYNHYLIFTYWLLQVCPLRAWIAFGKEKSTIRLYSKQVQ